MGLSQWRAQEAEFKRLARVKRSDRNSAAPIGPEMLHFFQHSVQKRQTKLSQLAACWAQLVPETLSDHCSLESLSRGTLVVMVDSASHLYELKQLLLAGLQQRPSEDGLDRDAEAAFSSCPRFQARDCGLGLPSKQLQLGEGAVSEF